MISSIKINTNFTLRELQVPIKHSIAQSTALIHWKAVVNAPYKTWNLRSSINLINEDYKWIVWVSQKTAPYWRVREYVNKKNPSRRFYMKRALESSKKEIEEFFKKNILSYIVKKK
jgi:hypothetical protein